MTGKGHRAVTFMLIGAATGSPIAALCGLFSSRLPDTLEPRLWGRKKGRHHRTFTHWFVPWLALALVCFHHSGWSLPHIQAPLEKNVWSCLGFWLLGGFLHILEDSVCGKVPFFSPRKRSFGFHLFRMSSEIGRISSSERAFVLWVVLLSLIVWLVRCAARYAA